MTNVSSLRLAFSGLLLAGGLAAAGTASALVLDTSDNKANAVLNISTSAAALLKKSNITLDGRGNAVSNAAGTTFTLPVTEANITVGLFKLTPVAGEAMGSAIAIEKGSTIIGMGNFALNFSSDLVYADVFIGGNTQNMAVFSFKEKTDLKLGLSGLNLNLYNTLGDLKLTTNAKNSFASALGLSAGLTEEFGNLNWGSIKVDITSAARRPAVNTSPFTAAQLVPEPATYAMMGLGLAGIGFVARRKARAA